MVDRPSKWRFNRALIFLTWRRSWCSSNPNGSGPAMFSAILLLIVLLNQIYAPFSRLLVGLKPDMALLAAVSGGLVYTPWGAAVLGFTAGLLQETLAGGLLGIGALSKGLTG